MTSTFTLQPTPAPRRDGWTDARRRALLDGLAAGLDVRRAVARVGLSREGAYRLRRRDAEFGRAWDAALQAARAADERRFLALLAEMPWAIRGLADDLRRHGLLPQDGVTSGPSV